MPTDAAVIQGVFSDFKLVKTRSVAQLVVEIPIEEAQEALRLFGVPLPGKEAPVAIARLVVPPAPPESVPLPVKNGDKADRARQAFRDDNEMGQAARLAGIFRKDLSYQKWLAGARSRMDTDKSYAENMAAIQRQLLGVKSCSEIATDPAAFERWKAHKLSFEIAVGRAAAPR